MLASFDLALPRGVRAGAEVEKEIKRSSLGSGCRLQGLELEFCQPHAKSLPLAVLLAAICSAVLFALKN